MIYEKVKKGDFEKRIKELLGQIETIMTINTKEYFKESGYYKENYRIDFNKYDLFIYKLRENE